MAHAKKKLEFYGGPYMSFMPIIIFIALIIFTTFQWRSTSDGAVWVPIFLALLIPFFLAKNKSDYADAIFEGIADKDVAVPVVCWIFAGVFARILRDSGFAVGIAGLAASFGVNGTIFTAVTFLGCLLFATATGTAFGTIAMGMGVLYPAGIALGAHPALLAGSIISGGAFGDNMAPVSDTFICSASAMGVEITKCVKSRAKYASVCGAITLVIICVVGTMLDSGSGAAVEIATNSKALVMLIPLVITLAIAIKVGNIVIATSVGSVISAVTAVALGLIDVVQVDKVSDKAALISVHGEGLDRVVDGIIYSGISGMIQVVVLALLLFAAINIMRRGGGDVKLMNLLAKVARGPVSSEVVLSLMVLLLSGLMGLTAPAILLVGPSFARPLAEKYKMSPYRVATLISAHAVTFTCVGPWTATMMLAVGFASGTAAPLNAIEITPFVIYAYVTTIVMFATTFLKIGQNDGLKEKN